MRRSRRLCCHAARAAEARRLRRRSPPPRCRADGTPDRGSRLRRQSEKSALRAAASAATEPPAPRRAREPPVLPEREERAGRATCRCRRVARPLVRMKRQDCPAFTATLSKQQKLVEPPFGAAGPLERGSCPRRRSEESALVVPPLPSSRRRSKGTTPVAPPFAAPWSGPQQMVSTAADQQGKKIGQLGCGTCVRPSGGGSDGGLVSRDDCNSCSGGRSQRGPRDTLSLGIHERFYCNPDDGVHGLAEQHSSLLRTAKNDG